MKDICRTRTGITTKNESFLVKAQQHIARHNERVIYIADRGARVCMVGSGYQAAAAGVGSVPQPFDLLILAITVVDLYRS